MSRLNTARLAIAAAAALLSSQAFAADSATLNVSANVQGICKLASVPAMAFTIDPSLAGPITASSAVTYRCTKNSAAPTVTVGAGGSPYTGSGAAALTSPGTPGTPMEFTVTWTNPVTGGLGFGQAPETVTLSGSIVAAQYQDANAAADYAASALVAINP